MMTIMMVVVVMLLLSFSLFVFSVHQSVCLSVFRLFIFMYKSMKMSLLVCCCCDVCCCGFALVLLRAISVQLFFFLIPMELGTYPHPVWFLIGCRRYVAYKFELPQFRFLNWLIAAVVGSTLPLCGTDIMSF